MIECTWCGSSYREYQVRCDNCGGPLPPPGRDAGEPPPPAPRQVPLAFERRVRYSNASFIGGVILLAIGCIQGLVFTSIGATIGLKPLMWVGPGVFLLLGGLGLLFLAHARRRAKGVLLAFREGEAARGEIREVFQDTSLRINGRSPWAVVYTFTAGGREIEGRAQSWDRRAVDRPAGTPVHVLFMPADPQDNTLWPPIK